MSPAATAIRARCVCVLFAKPACAIRFPTCLTVVVLLISLAPLRRSLMEMINRYFIAPLAVVILLAVASVPAFAQVGELRGHVWLQQADGQKVPLADAQIDVFRTDMKADYHTKTNKKGEFVFAGLPFIGTYVVSVSHPTAAPNFVPGVKAGRDIPVEITVTPGAGKRLTFARV